MARHGEVWATVPSVLVGLLLLVAAVAFWRAGPATRAGRLLALLLLLRGALNVVAPLWFVATFEQAAARLWPALDVLVAAVAGLLLAAVWDARPEGRIRRWFPPVVVVAALVLAVWLTWRPELYWGAGDEDGPWATVNGVKFVVYAALSLLWIYGYTIGIGGTARHAGLTLGLAFAFDVAHWAAADLLFVELLGAGLADVRGSPDHYARLVMWIPFALLLGLLVREMRGHEVDHVQEGCTFALLALFAPMAAVVGVAWLFALGVWSANATNLALVLWLDALWTLPLPLVVLMLLRHGRRSLQVLLGATVAGPVEVPPVTARPADAAR